MSSNEVELAKKQLQWLTAHRQDLINTLNNRQHQSIAKEIAYQIGLDEIYLRKVRVFLNNHGIST